MWNSSVETGLGMDNEISHPEREGGTVGTDEVACAADIDPPSLSLPSSFPLPPSP